ncbi:unnamed protein product [Microthlaspi erraticum]|uniref:Uncharacterized protein n=1 Tax=Microthlaspi erraticum TaxID=1685480 RepID=A0A6D2KF45_9BRAS|nr:unnamed protein product [Microthlaspi erraticum]
MKMTTMDYVEEEPLSPLARVFQSPLIDTCIITMIGFKSKISPDVILDDLRLNVSKHPRFCSKLSDNGARWVKTEVIVEDHVHAPEIDPQEVNEDGQRFVDDYVSRLTMIPLDRSRPLWDIHILNVKTNDAEAVGVIRCHHALADGMSLMCLLVACTRKSSDPEAFPSTLAIKRRGHFLPQSLGNKSDLLRSIFAIHHALTLIWNTVVDLLHSWATVLFLKDTETPLKQGGRVENKLKRFYHRTISLDDIKLIKNAMNMTINDVLLGVTQAALSRYLNGRYGNADVESGASTSDQNNLPGGIRLRAGVAVNLRKEIGIKVAAVLFKRLQSNTTTFFSNIAGPVEEVSLHGNHIAYIALSCYGNSQALWIHFISYGKKMIISMAVDPTVIPDPHNLCDEMEEALKAIKDTLFL